MDPRNDIQSLYDKAAEHLHTTRDAKLETLKLQIASARVYDIIITPESVSELLDKPVKEGNADFIALRAGGFIETHYTHLAWTRFDPVNRARSLAALAAFEANVALRARSRRGPFSIRALAAQISTKTSSLSVHSAILSSDQISGEK